MSPLVHGMIAWLLAAFLLRKSSDRRLVVIAGVCLDIDGVFILFDMDLYITYHHTFTHSLVFGLGVAIIGAALAKDRIETGLVCLGAFSLHILADVFGTNWGVYPFYPLSNVLMEFPIASDFIKYVIISPATFILCCVLIFMIMWKKNFSPFEFFSEKFDKWMIGFFVYPFRYKCHICEKIASIHCSECGKYACTSHIGHWWKSRCKECGTK